MSRLAIHQQFGAQTALIEDSSRRFQRGDDQSGLPHRHIGAKNADDFRHVLAVAAAVERWDERTDLQVQALSQFAAYDEFVALAAAKEPPFHAFKLGREAIQGHS